MAILQKMIAYSLALLLWCIPWQTAYVLKMPPVGTTGIISFTLLDGILLLLAVLVLLQEGISARRQGVKEYARRGIRRMRTLLGISCSALLIYIVLSILWSERQDIAILGAIRLLEAMGIAVLIITYRKYATLFAVCIVSSAVLQSLFAIWQFFIQESPASSWLGLAYHAAQQLGDAVVEVGDQRWLRAYGSFPHPNVLAAFLSLGLFLCAYLIGKVRSKMRVSVLLGAWSCILVGLFLTFSREVWIGTAVGFCVVGWLGRNKKWHGSGISPSRVALVIALFLLASLAILYWEPLSSRLGVSATKERLEQKSINERLESYQKGWSLVQSAPIIGVGMHQSTVALQARDIRSGTIRGKYEYQAPHNLFLLILAELGMIGVVLFIASGTAFVMWLRRRDWRSAPHFVGVAVMAFIAALPDHFFWTIQSGMMIWSVVFAFLGSHDTLDKES